MRLSFAGIKHLDLILLASSRSIFFTFYASLSSYVLISECHRGLFSFRHGMMSSVCVCWSQWVRSGRHPRPPAIRFFWWMMSSLVHTYTIHNVNSNMLLLGLVMIVLFVLS